jgi:PAS domain S-box-containing protein
MALNAKKRAFPRRESGRAKPRSLPNPADRPFQLSANDLLRIFDGSPVSIWVEDFSEIKASFDDLKRRGTRNFRAYFRAHPEEVIALAGAVRIINVNQATLGLYEASDRKQLQGGLGLVFNKESYDVFREEVIALAEGKTEFSGDVATKSLKGNTRHVLLKLVVPPGFAETLAFVLVFLVDITELKESQKDLADSEAKYRTVVDFAPDALVIADADSGIVLEANRRAQRLFGLPLEEIVGAHVAELVSEDYPGQLRKLVEARPGDLIGPLRGSVFARESGEKIPFSARSCLVGITGRKCILIRLREMDKVVPDTPGSGFGRPAALDPRGSRADLDKFSRRERDVIRLIAEGMTNKQIAKGLFISVKTVETHRSRIMEKLGVHRTADIVRFAIYSGLCGDPSEKP